MAQSPKDWRSTATLLRGVLDRVERVAISKVMILRPHLLLPRSLRSQHFRKSFVGELQALMLQAQAPRQVQVALATSVLHQPLPVLSLVDCLATGLTCLRRSSIQAARESFHEGHFLLKACAHQHMEKGNRLPPL